MTVYLTCDVFISVLVIIKSTKFVLIGVKLHKINDLLFAHIRLLGQIL